MNELIIEHKKNRAVLLVLGCIIMTIVITMFLVYATPLKYNGIMMKVIILFLVFCIGLLLVDVIFTLTGKVKLVIDRRGFTDSTSFSSVGFTPWSEVDDIFINEFLEDKFLAVKIKDGYISQLSGAQKILFKINKNLGLNVINIALSNSDENHEEILVTMNYFWNNYKSNLDHTS